MGCDCGLQSSPDTARATMVPALPQASGLRPQAQKKKKEKKKKKKDSESMTGGEQHTLSETQKKGKSPEFEILVARFRCREVRKLGVIAGASWAIASPLDMGGGGGVLDQCTQCRIMRFILQLRG